jgi:hypothetical protein
MILWRFLRFLNAPTANDEKINIHKKLIGFVGLFFTSVLLVYGSTFVLQLFISQPVSEISDLSFEKLVLFALLLAPLFEELVFRLSLIYSKLNLSISLSLAIASIITSVLDIRLLTLFGGVTFFFAFCSLYIVLNNLTDFQLKIESFWEKHFILVFYILSFLFGIFHMANYQLNSFSALTLAFVFSVPQIIGALFLGFVRIRLGFIWAVVMHVLFNAVPFGLMLVFG